MNIIEDILENNSDRNYENDLDKYIINRNIEIDSDDTINNNSNSIEDDNIVLIDKKKNNEKDIISDEFNEINSDKSSNEYTCKQESDDTDLISDIKIPFNISVYLENFNLIFSNVSKIKITNNLSEDKKKIMFKKEIKNWVT